MFFGYLDRMARLYEHDMDESGNIISDRTEIFKYKIVDQHLYTDDLDHGVYKDDWKDEGAISISNNILTVTRSSGNVKRYKRIKKSNYCPLKIAKRSLK